MTRKLYAALMLVEKMKLQACGTDLIPFGVQDSQTGMVGMVPVYATLAAATEAFPDAAVVELTVEEGG